MQSRYFARVVSGQETLPSNEEMKAWISDVQERQAVTQRFTDTEYFLDNQKTWLGAESMPGANIENGTTRSCNGFPVQDFSNGAAGSDPVQDFANRASVSEALAFLPTSTGSEKLTPHRNPIKFRHPHPSKLCSHSHRQHHEICHPPRSPAQIF